MMNIAKETAAAANENRLFCTTTSEVWGNGHYTAIAPPITSEGEHA